ncbi:MAG TPA: sel1 repeat family protein, partial [Gammaproteobacteria bacterium]|nr:sel1 repeat family protein [Gammaproteobacteria bacterium]
MFNLAGIFWEGRGTQQDFSRAVHWWQQAAAHDDSTSQYNLGLAYFLGQGVTSNPAQAIAWLQKANRNGYPGAQSALELVKDSLSEPPPSEIVSQDAEAVVSPGSTSAVPTETDNLTEATTATTIIPTGTSEIVSPTMSQDERLAPTAITPTSSSDDDTPTIANVVTPAGVP